MPLPVISVAQMREWEAQTWASGQIEDAVIKRVGVDLANRISNLTVPGASILLLAGKGNNGKDVTAAAERIGARGVNLVSVLDPAKNLESVEKALATRPALVVDGLFGIGLNRPLDPGWCAVIQRVNHSRLPVLSVDTPSGLDAESGTVQGAAIQASITVTVGAPKKGLLQPEAWPYVGRLEVASQVGLLPCPFQSDLFWTLGADFHSFPPRRSVTAHKGTQGHLAIMAGSLGFHGAAVLATRGAQRAQPGLITLHTFESIYTVVASQLQSAMVTLWTGESLPASNWTATLVGPGLAGADVTDQVKHFTRILWRDSSLPVIVDASALDWLPLDRPPKASIRVVTPHPGEAARMLRTTVQKVQSNRPQALRELSRRLGDAWVILKGHQTLIVRSTGPVYCNSSGNPCLGQGGSGDLLSGYIAGLLAQPVLTADVCQTLRYAVWQHGASADVLQQTQRNWIIEDLAGALGSVAPERD